MRIASKIALLLLAPALWAQSTVPDPTVVSAYAKVGELMKISKLTEAAIAVEGTNTDGKGTKQRIDAADLNLKLKREEIVFRFSNWKSGPVTEINAKKWGEVLSLPPASEKTLKVAISPMNFLDFDVPSEQFVGDAKWTDRDPSYNDQKALQIMLNMPVQGVLALGSARMTDYTDVTFTRYTSYEVTYTYQSKTVGPYMALFFFGARPDGQEVTSPQDLVFDSQALYTAITHPLEPRALTRTYLRDIPEVKQYLIANQVSSERCVLGKGQLCCVGDKCGLAGPDLAEVLAKPLVRKDDPKQ
jgi:hypothetical protein